MKRFIIKSLLFLLPLAVVLAGVEYFLRLIPNDYSYKSQWLDSNSNKVKIWCFGTSHGYFGINPDYFSKESFNSGHVCQGIKFDHYIFKKYMDKTNSLETVIIPVSYSSLWSNMEKGNESWKVPNYHIYYGYNDMKFALRFKVINESKPFSRAVKSFLKMENNISCTELGWYTLNSFESKSPEWKETGKTACKWHTIKKLDDDVQKINEEYIIDICSICKSKNVKVILLTTPTYHTYYELLDSIQLSKTIDFCRKTEESFDNVSYINLLKDNRFTDDDFYDADHLDEFGAKKLTLILNETIEIICNR